MFKRIEKKQKRQAEIDELGLDENAKEMLGIQDTDSDESESESDAEASEDEMGPNVAEGDVSLMTTEWLDTGNSGSEDEEDSDMSFSGLDRSSSYDSFDEDDLPRSVTHLQFSADHTPLEMTPQVQPRSVSASPSPSPSPSPCPTPTGPVHQISTPNHANRASLSKTWMPVLKLQRCP